MVATSVVLLLRLPKTQGGRFQGNPFWDFDKSFPMCNIESKRWNFVSVLLKQAFLAANGKRRSMFSRGLIRTRARCLFVCHVK